MKNRIVSKKELEDSGLSLRDFLNKERGLTRKAPEGTKFGEYKSRDNYVRSGQKSFDTETENVPPNMSNYKPRREPKPLTEVSKPGTSTNYENTETSDMMFKRGGSASSRGDGIAQRGKTKGTIVMCGGGYMKGKK